MDAESERQALEAAELYRGGATLHMIATRNGLGEAEVSALINEVLATATISTRLRTIDRLERMTQLLWPRVLKGELGAMERVESIERAKLKALSAPEPRAITGENDLERFKSRRKRISRAAGED